MCFDFSSSIMSSKLSIKAKMTFMSVGGDVLSGRYPIEAFVFSAWYVSF